MLSRHHDIVAFASARLFHWSPLVLAGSASAFKVQQTAWRQKWSQNRQLVEPCCCMFNQMTLHENFLQTKFPTMTLNIQCELALWDICIPAMYVKHLNRIPLILWNNNENNMINIMLHLQGRHYRRLIADFSGHSCANWQWWLQHWHATDVSCLLSKTSSHLVSRSNSDIEHGRL